LQKDQKQNPAIAKKTILFREYADEGRSSLTEAVLLIFGLLLFLLFIGLPVAFSLLLVAISGLYIVTGGPEALHALAAIAFTRVNGLGFLTIPLFVLMASIVNQSGMSRDLFDIANKWLGRLPGGLAQATVAGCAAFGATTGSSVACVLTIGKVALPEMERSGYSPRLAAGAISGGGALGMLIPPSLSLITYSVITDTSLGRLFVAALVPGVIIAILCMGYIALICMPGSRNGINPPPVPFRIKLRAIYRGWPLIVLVFGVLGSIYLGICTATESAAIGVLVSILLGFLVYKTLTIKTLFQASVEAALTTAVISFIVYGGFVFGHFFTITGIAQFISEIVVGMNVSPWLILVMMNLIVMGLGCFLDVGSILLLTMPAFFPLAMDLKFDPVWFGVVMAVNLEIAVMTPPFGLNLYVLRDISEMPMKDIVFGALPFVGIYVIGLMLVAAFPQLALWLTGSM